MVFTCLWEMTVRRSWDGVHTYSAEASVYTIPEIHWHVAGTLGNQPTNKPQFITVVWKWDKLVPLHQGQVAGTAVAFDTYMQNLSVHLETRLWMPVYSSNNPEFRQRVRQDDSWSSRNANVRVIIVMPMVCRIASRQECASSCWLHQ